MHSARSSAAMHCCRSVCKQKCSKLTFQRHEPAVRPLSAQQLWSVRDALCQKQCGSALLPVIVALCERPINTGELVVRHACCQTVVCTAALISEGCTLPDALLQCTVAGHCASSKCSNLILTAGACLFNVKFEHLLLAH